MPFDHEREIKSSLGGEFEVPKKVTEKDAGDDCGAGGAETSTERDSVVCTDDNAGRESGNVVRAENIEGDSG